MKYKKLLVSIMLWFISLTLIFFGIKKTWSIVSAPKEEYKDSTFFQMKLKNGVFDSLLIQDDDCFFKDNKYMFDIFVGTDEDIMCSRDLLVYVNYRQVQFEIGNSKEYNYVFKKSAHIMVAVDRKYFYAKNNSLIFIVRNNIDVHVDEHDILEDVAPFTLRYSFVINDNNRIIKKPILIYANDYKNSHSDETIDVLWSNNEKNNRTRTKINDKLNMTLVLPDSLNGKYVLFALCDNRTVKINGNNYIEIKSNGSSKCDCSIKVTNEVGVHEFYMFLVPKPYHTVKDTSFSSYSVISVPRKTIHIVQ